jgi:hypothetical protein
VEQLSGKPVELGPGSAPGVGIKVDWGMRLSHAKLVPSPEAQGSWWGVALVIPCRARALQSLRGGGFEGKGSRLCLDPVRPKRWGSRQGMDLVWG